MSVRGITASAEKLRFFYAFSLGLLAALALPAAASATVLPAWGSSLSATPNYDLANGDYTPNAMEGFRDINPAPGSRTALLDPGNAADPSYHGGDDAAVWNPGDTAPTGGQVREIKVKGCAWNDPTATGYPNNELSGGYPVNKVNFQTLSPSGGSFTATATAAGFPIPFCSNSDSPSTGAVNTSTVSTFQPLHMCVSAGDVIDMADVGGFIPTSHSYPNGVPFLVLAGGGAAPGSTLNSYVHVTQAGGKYATTSSNFGSEPNEQLQLQVIEGTGDDAYGLCPGGTANEPSDSNQIICVYHSASADGYPLCDRNGQPIPGSGGSGSGSGATKPSAVQVALSALRLNPASFFAAKGTTVTYTDNKAAKTTLHVFRLVPGMRHGKACVAIPKHKHGHVVKCTRMVGVKTLVHQDKAGGNAVKLRGLKPAKYELKVIATMGSGRSLRIAHFTVKGKRR